MGEKLMKFAGVVVLYNPDKMDVLNNINTYINHLDKLYLIDNSATNNQDKFKDTYLNKIEYIWK